MKILMCYKQSCSKTKNFFCRQRSPQPYIHRRLGVVSGGSLVPDKMKCHSLHGRGNMKNLCCVPSLVSLLAATWLLVVTADASVLLEGDPSETIVSLTNPLELQPPDGRTGEYFGFSLAHYINNNQRW